MAKSEQTCVMKAIDVEREVLADYKSKLEARSEMLKERELEIELRQKDVSQKEAEIASKAFLSFSFLKFH